MMRVTPMKSAIEVQEFCWTNKSASILGRKRSFVLKDRCEKVSAEGERTSPKRKRVCGETIEGPFSEVGRV